MKTLNIWDFPKKLHSLSIKQNTLKTQGIWNDFSKKLGNSPFYMQNINRSYTVIQENSE